MSEHEVRIIDPAGFSNVETVTATAFETDRGGVAWRYDELVSLKAGDAIENPPPGGSPGDVCTLRIVRRFRQTAQPGGPEA
jgi:hypothetical protein